jgi:hypothetical protein
MEPQRSRRMWVVLTLLVIVIVLVALVTDQMAVAEMLGGALVVSGAIWAGLRLNSDPAQEAHSELAIDLMLVLVVFVFLAGVTLISLALPIRD